MNAFIKDLLSISWVVILGKSSAIKNRLAAERPEKLIAGQAIIGLFIGLWSFSIVKALVFPVFLLAVTIIWLFAYAAISNATKDELPVLQSYFFGSSLFLAPAVIPFLGPLLLILFIPGWPFVLARVLAEHRQLPPGKVFIQIAIPPLCIWLVIEFCIFVLGLTL